MSATISLHNPSPEKTSQLGASLAHLLEPGDVVLLDGELGAGKTTFTSGLAHGLGVQETIWSPTFTLVRILTSGRIPLAHVDLYRLKLVGEIDELGIDELLEQGSVVVVEWGEPAAGIFGPSYLEIKLAYDLSAVGDSNRHITLEGFGPRWLEAWPQVEECVVAAGLTAQGEGG